MSVRNTIVVTVRLSMSYKQLFVENAGEIDTSSWRKAFYIENSVLDVIRDLTSQTCNTGHNLQQFFCQIANKFA